MKFQPKTEEELQKEMLCPEGPQPFTVMEAAIVQSKSEKNAGKEMLKLKLNVHADDGFDYHIYDYVADWFMGHKLRHFLYAINCGQDYESGNIANPSRYVGRTGMADIVVREAKGNYKAMAGVLDYSAPGPDSDTPTTEKAQAKVEAQKPAEDDDLPF